jgi:hypothetical protein
LDAPRIKSILFQHICLHVHGGKGNIELELVKRDIFFFLDGDSLNELSHNGQLKFSVLYDFLNVLSDSQVLQKISDKEYIGTVSLLHEFLNVLSDVMS